MMPYHSPYMRLAHKAATIKTSMEMEQNIATTITKLMRERDLAPKKIVADIQPMLGLSVASTAFYLNRLANGQHPLPTRAKNLKVTFDRVRTILEYLGIEPHDPLMKKMKNMEDSLHLIRGGYT